MKRLILIGLLLVSLLMLTGCTDYDRECRISFERSNVNAAAVNDTYILCCSTNGWGIDPNDCTRIKNEIER